MSIFKISLVLFSSVFIRISKTQEILPENTISGHELDNCVCFPHGETQHPELLNPKENDFQRLVLYIYKDFNTNVMKVFTPDPDKQAIIPDIPISATDEFKTATSETISSHINKAFDNIFNKGKNVANTGENLIELIPDATEIINSNNGHQISQEINEVNNIHQENSQANTLHNPLNTLAYLYESNKLNPYQKLKPIQVFNHLKEEFNKKKSDLISIKTNMQSNPNKEAMELKKKLTFDQWFHQQMKIFRDNKVSQGGHALNTDILKTLIQKVLIENNINIEAPGLISLITDDNGASISLKNLELRSIVIGKPVTYHQVLKGDLTLEDKVPYLEGILITLLYPPKILGIISLRDEYYTVISDRATNSRPSDLNIDFSDHKSYTEDDIYHVSSTSSDSKPNLDTSSEPALNTNPTEIVHGAAPNSTKHWLHTLLHAVINSNNENILNASKDKQKHLMFKSKNKKQTIQDNDSWKIIDSASQHSTRMNNEIDPYQKSEDPSLLMSSNRLLSGSLPIWNLKNMHWPAYLSKYESSELKLRPTITAPCEVNTNSLPEKNHYSIQYNPVDWERDREIIANDIPSQSNLDFSSNSNNFRIPYSDLKGYPYNIQANLMTLPYNKILEHIYPTHKGVQQTSYYKTHWNPPANFIYLPHINYRSLIYDSIESGPSPNVGKVSNLVGTYPISFPYHVNKDYSSLPDIIDNQDLYYNFQDIKEESIHPGNQPYLKPMDINGNILSLSNWNTKDMGNKNAETNNFENLVDVNKPRVLRIQVSEPNGKANNLILRQNRKQGFSQIPGPGLSIVNSVVNRFMSLLQNDNNDRSGSQVEFDVSTKRPDDKKYHERPDYRIIGGSAATGSGAPVSNKGRSRF